MQNILTWSIYFKVKEESRENSGKFWSCVLRRHLISTCWPSVAFDFSIESFKLIITEEIAELLTVTQTFDWQLHSPGCHTLRYDISSSDKDWKSMARVSLRQPAVWLMLLQGKRWCWPLTHTHTHTHTLSLSISLSLSTKYAVLILLSIFRVSMQSHYLIQGRKIWLW